jgi:hypothetical protein
MNALSMAARACRAPAAAAVLAAIALSGCVGPAPDTTLQVTTDAPADQPVTAGQRVTFDVTVTNIGQHPASQVSLYPGPDRQAALWSVACTAAQGVACPGAFADQPVVRILPPGASITFEYVFTIAPDATGSVDNHVQVSSYSDSKGPRDAVAHATVHDLISGPYHVFASNGQRYDVDVDFSAARFTLQGNGPDATAALARDPVDFSYVAGAGPTMFRTPPGMLAGTLDLGAGSPQPFVAASTFATTLVELDGVSFVVFGRDLPAGGGAHSHLFTASIAGATMTTCVDPTLPAPADCPAALQRRYALAAGGDGSFTAVDATLGDTTTFFVAESLGHPVFLRADASPIGRRFDVGMPGPDKIPATALVGGDTRGRWGASLLSIAGAYVNWRLPDGTGDEMTPLAQVPGAPYGLLAGTRQNDDAPLMAVDFGPLALVLGVPLGAADGEMAIFAF